MPAYKPLYLDMKNKNEALKEEIDDLHNTILHLESEKDDMENDVKNLNRDRIKQVRELCKEKKELKEENEKLKNDLRLCAEGLIPNDLIQREIVETCREEVEKWKSKANVLQEENDKLMEEIKALNISLAGAREVRKRLDYAIRKLSEETISRVEHQKLADHLNAEAEKYKVKFMEATGQLQ